MATAPPKILTIGSPNGSLKKLVKKITAFQTAHGPFECCVIVGNLFTSQDDGSSLTSDLEFPIPTYFIHPTHPLSEPLSQRLEGTGPEVVPNLIYLGKSGLFKTGSGVSIGYVDSPFDESLPSQLLDTAATNITAQIDSLLTNDAFVQLTVPPTTPTSTLASGTNSININPTTGGTAAASQSGDLSLAEARALAKKESELKENPSYSKGLDLLLLNVPTSKIAAFWGGIPQSTSNTVTVPRALDEKVQELIRKSRPRYVLLCETPDLHVTSGEPDADLGNKRMYMEEPPIGWPSHVQGQRDDERWTRVIRLDRFAAPTPTDGKKGAKGESKQFYYAFTLPSKHVKPAGVQANPFLLNNRGTKRPGDELNDSEKRVRGEEGARLPADYVCRICNQPGHHIRDCPEKTDRPKGPPPDYVCHRCNQPGHWIKDCPETPANGGGPKRDLKPLTMDECWFCLANPKCDTSLIVTVGNDVYTALSKGQLIKTGDAKHPPVVPGGGHLLIIPIQHVPNPLLLPDSEAKPLLAEIAAIKQQITRAFAQHDAVPVFCDMYRNLSKVQHGQIQAIPIPKDKASKVEDMFRRAAKSEGWEFEEGDAESLLRGGKGREFIKIDCPDGKTLVHFIEGKFNMQFARSHLADFLGTPDRANWQVCQTTEKQVKMDVAACKKALESVA